LFNDTLNAVIARSPDVLGGRGYLSIPEKLAVPFSSIKLEKSCL